MKVTEIDKNTIITRHADALNKIPDDRVHSFLLARNLTTKLLDIGLISEEEFIKIMAKNIDSFLPEIASLYH